MDFFQNLRKLTEGEVSLFGSPPVYLFCLELAALLKLNEQHFYLFGQIQTSQTGGQPYSNTSPYEVSECSLAGAYYDLCVYD